MGSHFAISSTCRALLAAARDDRIWIERLARDFPLASRTKPLGKLHSVYRMLAKSQLNTRSLRSHGIGPVGVFGAIQGMIPETPNHTEFAQVEIRLRAAQF